MRARGKLITEFHNNKEKYMKAKIKLYESKEVSKEIEISDEKTSKNGKSYYTVSVLDQNMPFFRAESGKYYPISIESGDRIGIGVRTINILKGQQVLSSEGEEVSVASHWLPRFEFFNLVNQVNDALGIKPKEEDTSTEKPKEKAKAKSKATAEEVEVVTENSEVPF